MEFSLSDVNNFRQISQVKLSNQILETNEKSSEYGLSLTENQAKELSVCRNETLVDEKRIEFKESAVLKIIDKFCESSFIVQSEYAQTLAELIEIFYENKNESEDSLTDDELIDVMFRLFENTSRGSIEDLRSRDLDAICRNIRHKARNIFDPDSRYDENDKEEIYEDNEEWYDEF